MKMIVLPQMVEILVTSNTQKYYESLGYKIPRVINKWGKYQMTASTRMMVYVLHLKNSSHIQVEVLCDYCGISHQKFYSAYTRGRKYEIQKDACQNCMVKKSEELVMLRYGVKNMMQTIEMKNYHNNRINNMTDAEKEDLNRNNQEKKIISNNIKYGVDHPMQTPEVRETLRLVIQEKYGVNNIMERKETKDKIKQTNLKKFGFENSLSSPIIIAKRIKTLYENGTAPSSSQQRHMHSIIGGELNFPHDVFSLDVAFPDEKIYLEYDGSGHWLSVTFGDETIKEFNERNKKRWYVLNKKGWKQIVVISKKDYLPSDETILEMFNYAKSYLNSGHSWIKFDIDEGTVSCSQYKINYDFGSTKIFKINRKSKGVEKSASFIL